MEEAQKVVNDARKTVDTLAGEKQAIWASLKWSISQRFDYWFKVIIPF